VTVVGSTLGPTAYWYLTRATGVVALVLLTAVVVLGVIGPMRLATNPRWPRFAIDSVHRDLSLLAVAVIVIHVITTVLDGFAPISLVDAIIPFHSAYRPLWLGLGALAFDLIIALVITSLTRRRLGYRAWRLVHWLAYACWPVAVLHGLGTGSDSRQAWALLVTFLCVATVGLAVLARLRRAESIADPARVLGVVGTAGTFLGLVVFTLLGPLAGHWAERSGTPKSLLASYVRRPVARRSVPASTPSTTVVKPVPLKLPFSDRLAGTISQQQAGGGAILDLELRMTGQVTGALRIRLGGQPLAGGGLSLTGSQVDLVAAGLPTPLQGKITSLDGTRLSAHVAGDRQPVNLLADLSIDDQTGTVSGTLHGVGAR
jgi:DMSO/TMAO reductase YedYZ heme-binding membrane subunit